MSEQFDFISATDKPALLAFSTPEWLDEVKKALQQLGYKVHTAATHSDFLVRFSQVHYKVVIIEERFAANTLEEKPDPASPPADAVESTASCNSHSHRRIVPDLHPDAGLSTKRSRGHQQLGTVPRPSIDRKICRGQRYVPAQLHRRPITPLHRSGAVTARQLKPFEPGDQQ